MNMNDSYPTVHVRTVSAGTEGQCLPGQSGYKLVHGYSGYAESPMITPRIHLVAFLNHDLVTSMTVRV
ncbi:hypothetical protein GF325_04200 [Candidatus Bathyarchaeota archaeon]|nr:hypothetical protein [Candidatus Bathyarchaeota archaeon]